jgi:hypothetical protein
VPNACWPIGLRRSQRAQVRPQQVHDRPATKPTSRPVRSSVLTSKPKQTVTLLRSSILFLWHMRSSTMCYPFWTPGVTIPLECTNHIQMLPTLSRRRHLRAVTQRLRPYRSAQSSDSAHSMKCGLTGNLHQNRMSDTQNLIGHQIERSRPDFHRFRAGREQPCDLSNRLWSKNARPASLKR